MSSKVVVLDLGGGLLKAGIAGQPGPKYVPFMSSSNSLVQLFHCCIASRFLAPHTSPPSPAHSCSPSPSQGLPERCGQMQGRQAELHRGTDHGRVPRDLIHGGPETVRQGASLQSLPPPKIAASLHWPLPPPLPCLTRTNPSTHHAPHRATSSTWSSRRRSWPTPSAASSMWTRGGPRLSSPSPC